MKGESTGTRRDRNSSLPRETAGRRIGAQTQQSIITQQGTPMLQMPSVEQPGEQEAHAQAQRLASENPMGGGPQSFYAMNSAINRHHVNT